MTPLKGHSGHAWLLFLVPFVHQNILESFFTEQLMASCLNQGEAGHLYFFKVPQVTVMYDD